MQRQPSAHASGRYARSDDSHLNDDIVSDSRAKQAIRDDGRDDGSVARSSYDRLETPLARPVVDSIRQRQMRSTGFKAVFL